MDEYTPLMSFEMPPAGPPSSEHCRLFDHKQPTQRTHPGVKPRRVKWVTSKSLESISKPYIQHTNVTQPTRHIDKSHCIKYIVLVHSEYPISSNPHPQASLPSSNLPSPSITQEPQPLFASSSLKFPNRS